MGAGRGRTRRAQRKDTRVGVWHPLFDNTFSFQEKEWKKFLKKQGIKSLSFRKYYLGKKNPKRPAKPSHIQPNPTVAPNLTNDEYARMCKDFLNDLLATGALQWGQRSSMIRPEQFAFKVVDVQKSAHYQAGAKKLVLEYRDRKSVV